ncbi:DUF981 family protein [Micromonospora polyrhachis]|uniref:Putative membrane protein n=1 Tax=Micromonospora polyrhachis TaxID=1282883 RepID=A0A7W7SPD7_9ACTN|nr:DUF981 family protein [Micromonospora polyrhachis]MBB4958477.1 putative membrane protein [Micromonospora polyrhachis]
MTGLLAQDGLKINWVEMPTYNTVMALAAGVGLVLVVAFGWQVVNHKPIVAEGWAAAFAVLGVILFLTGLHMTLTWPLASGGFAFDNIIFGEPALAFGALMLGAALVLWRRAPMFEMAAGDAGGIRTDQVRRLFGPISVFVFALGLACFAIAAAGWTYTLFAAPPEEPISGEFADYPWIEATFISGLYVLTGIGAVLLPLGLRKMTRPLLIAAGVAWGIAGVVFTLFGALNFFTHIGLIVNTQ